MLAVGSALVVGACNPDATTSERLSDEIDRFLLQEAERGRFSGAVLIAKEGEVLLERGYGFADREERIPNTPATQFRLGSTSKLLTRVAVLLEEERDALDTDQPLSAFFPEYPEGDRITLANLINHTSGIPDLYAEPRYSQASAFMEPITVTELIGLFQELPLAFEPGTQVLYSSPGYVLLSQVVGETSGIPFEEYLEERVFKPLGMEGSGHLGFHAPDQPATGYELQGGDLASTGEMDATYFVGSGGVFSSIRDLYRLYQALYEEDFLSERSMQEFTVGRHLGRIWGFRSCFEPMPSRGIVVIVLSNFFHTPVEAIVPEIMTILLRGDVSTQPVEGMAAYVGRYQAPDFDRIGREIRVVSEVDGLGLSIVDTSGHVLEFALRPWVKDRFFCLADGRFTGLMAAFDRDAAGRIPEVTLDVYGWRIRAARLID
jgi:CubicO group peptidase (beta-lactamase class C family)